MAVSSMKVFKALKIEVCGCKVNKRRKKSKHASNPIV